MNSSLTRIPRGRAVLRIVLIWAIYTFGERTPFAQDHTNSVTLHFSDATRPGVLKVSLFSGDIVLQGHESKDVVVSSSTGTFILPPDLQPDAPAPGIKVEEEENTISIKKGAEDHTGDLHIKVPFATSIKLNLLTAGQISVD